MANQQPPKNRPTAVATPIGWAHDKTGEQLVSVRGLAPAEGTEDYRPNSPVWMKAFHDLGFRRATAVVLVGVYTVATMNLRLTVNPRKWQSVLAICVTRLSKALGPTVRECRD